MLSTVLSTPMVILSGKFPSFAMYIPLRLNVALLYFPLLRFPLNTLPVGRFLIGIMLVSAFITITPILRKGLTSILGILSRSHRLSFMLRLFIMLPFIRSYFILRNIYLRLALPPNSFVMTVLLFVILFVMLSCSRA